MCVCVCSVGVFVFHRVSKKKDILNTRDDPRVLEPTIEETCFLVESPYSIGKRKHVESRNETLQWANSMSKLLYGWTE